MNGQGQDWFFTTVKTQKKCRHCGRRSGFHDEPVLLDGEEEHVVSVCNHCGEYNGEVEED